MVSRSRSARGTSLGGSFLCLALLFFLHGAAAGGLQAQAQPPTGAAPLAQGVLVANVPCLRNPQQGYALFLPSRYTPERSWPIVYAFDPGARGHVPVQMLKELAEKYGYIVIGSNNSHNGPLKDQMEAAQAIWQDAHDRFSVDDKRQYATGFSGGARAAALFALLCNRCVAGVIAHGAGLPPTESSPEKVYFGYFLAVGNLDFNYPELVELHRQLDQLGITNRLREFSGPHQWAPPEVWAEAIEWMELLAMKEGRRPKDEKLIAELLQRAMQHARELEEEKNAYAAYEEYRALAGEFQGLADTAPFVSKVSQLKDSAGVREAIKRTKEELDEQQRLAADLLAALSALQTQTVVTPAIRSQLHRKMSELRDTAQSEKTPWKVRAARRALSDVFARYYETGESKRRDKDFALATALFEFASEASPGSSAPFYQLARIYAETGKKEKALEALRESVGRGLRNAALLQETPEFASLKDDPEFKKILAGMNPSP